MGMNEKESKYPDWVKETGREYYICKYCDTKYLWRDLPDGKFTSGCPSCTKWGIPPDYIVSYCPFTAATASSLGPYKDSYHTE
jgi:hypothetical protein